MDHFPKPVNLRQPQRKENLLNIVRPRRRTKILSTFLTVLISVFVVSGAVFAGTTIGQYISIGSGTPDLTLGDGDLYVTGTLEVDSDLAAKTGGAATFVVAASDASDRVKNQADYVADGTADDVEIQAAIDALPAAGGKVVLSEGTFTLAAGVELGDDTVLSGMGDGTKLTFAASVGDVTMITNKNATPGTRAGTGNFRITVRDMYIDGDKDNRGVGELGVSTVQFSTVDTVRIENLTVMNGWTTAIRTEFVTNAVIRGNRTHNSGDDGIAINEETFYASVAENIISNTGVGKNFGGPRGIEVQDGSHDVVVAGNSITNTVNEAIGVANHAGKDPAYNISIVSNVIKDTPSTGSGIRIFAQPGQLVKDVVVSSNVIASVDNGIEVVQGTQVLVTNNIVHDNLGMGIRVPDGSQHVKVSNNYVYDNGVGLSDQNGIRDDGADTIIELNEVRDTGGGTQLRGIHLGPDSAGAIVKNNRLDNHSTGNITFGAGASNYIIKQNEGFVTEASGTSTIPSAATSTTVTHGLAVTPAAGDCTFVGAEDPTNSVGTTWIDTYTSTQMTLNVENDPGASNFDVNWTCAVY